MIFSRWANFFERGKKVSTFLEKEFPNPRGRKKTLVSDWGAEITKIFGTVLGRESICFQVNPLNDALRHHIIVRPYGNSLSRDVNCLTTTP